MRRGVKITLISILCVVVAGAVLVGALWYFGRSTEPVEVSPVSYHTTYYWGDDIQYDGLVTADNMQSIFPSSTQTVTEVFVTEGQSVKVGDPLLSYDTTLSDIQLERQKIAVQQAELNLENAKKDLAQINSMKPYSPPPPTQPTEPSTEALEPVPELPYYMCGDGSRENPYRWVWGQDMSFDAAFVEKTFGESSEVWLAFEVRDQNSLEGDLLSRWGLHVQKDAETGALCYSFFEPDDAPSEEKPDPDESENPPEDVWVDDSSGFTAAEIAQMRSDKEREIRDLEVSYRIAQVEYERMQNEVENGIVYSKVDGEVIRLIDAETAQMEGSAMMVVSGGGCYYVNVSIGEYDREAYGIGTEVRVMSWMSGTETYGTVESIGDTPTSGYYYGGGNPNVSLYTARVAVPVDAGLTENEYVSVTFTSGEENSGKLYLDNMYIRTENGQSYVYKRDEEGNLVKVNVRTGECLWNSYTAVYGDLTEEDYIAFPYGKDVKEGAPTVEADPENYWY